MTFELVNTSDRLGCLADETPYQVRGRMVGPRNAIIGRAGVLPVNVLLHDVGTGGWFWHMRRYERFDYATNLAKAGHTSLVLDRLGYGNNRIPNGDGTCLDAQAYLLNQIVTHLYSGMYEFVGRPNATTPHASRVIVHAHGHAAEIATLETTRYGDTFGLVIMGWAGPDSSSAERAQQRAQTLSCARGTSFAPYGPSRRTYRRLLLRNVPRHVRRVALARRNPTPCGEVNGYATTRTTSRSTASRVLVPTLLIAGNRDPRLARGGARNFSTAFTEAPNVAVRIVPGAGSSLPLQLSAAQNRRHVSAWLYRHYNFVRQG